MSNKGFTLSEILIGFGLTAVLLLAGMSIFKNVNFLLSNTSRASFAQTDLNLLLYELKRIYGRTEKPVELYQVGSGAAGYDIFQNGVAILKADLRQAPSFTPQHLSDVNNLSEVRLLCCGQNMTFTPPAGASAPLLTSACTGTPGASLEVVDSSGQSQRKVCFKNVLEMNVAQMGHNDIKGSNYYFHRFGISGKSMRFGRDSQQGLLEYLEAYLSPGYTIKPTTLKRSALIIPNDNPFFTER